jgi:hypothetical protein
MLRNMTLRRWLSTAREWLSERLTTSELKDGVSSARPRVRLAFAIISIFSIAFGVRLLHWQDMSVEIEQEQTLATSLIRPYRQDVRRMNAEGGLLFPSRPVDPGDARRLVHPPGYSLLLRALYSEGAQDESFRILRLSQVTCDALAAVLVFLIALQLLPPAPSVIAGLLVATSPPLAHYSLWLSPESLAVLPVLLCVYLILSARHHLRLSKLVAAGVFAGLSCWLRSNALLLAPFLGVVVFLSFDRGKRLRSSLALVGVAAAMIAPITIRNWLLYERFIPLSLGAGITLIEGIAEYDKEGRFSLPATDKEAAERDVEWHNNPEYGGNLWAPDGVERERERFARGIAVIRSNPGWFLAVMIDRAWGMLRYNDSLGHGWHYHIAAVPVVAAEPPFGHSSSIPLNAQQVWSKPPEQLLAEGELLSNDAKASLSDDGQSMQIIVDASGVGDQFASAPLAVDMHTDYLLTLSAGNDQGRIATKVTSVDRGVTIAYAALAEDLAGSKRREEKKPPDAGAISLSDLPDGQTGQMITLAFATSHRSGVRLVVSRNSAGSVPSVVKIGRLQLVNAGATPRLWTQYPRLLIRGLQKNLFKTVPMLLLVVAGIVLLAVVRRNRALLVLLAVPVYYLTVQSVLHTEYRYIIAVHYFLPVAAATTLCCIGAAILQGIGLMSRFIRESC